MRRLGLSWTYRCWHGVLILLGLLSLDRLSLLLCKVRLSLLMCLSLGMYLSLLLCDEVRVSRLLCKVRLSLLDIFLLLLQ